MLAHPHDPFLCQLEFRRCDCVIDMSGFEAPKNGAEIGGSPLPRRATPAARETLPTIAVPFSSRAPARPSPRKKAVTRLAVCGSRRKEGRQLNVKLLGAHARGP
jgi:hypothetical protein